VWLQASTATIYAHRFDAANDEATGILGGDEQYISWIHDEDFVRAVYWLIERGEMDGAVNLAAPEPLPNADFMRALRQAGPLAGERVRVPVPPLERSGSRLVCAMARERLGGARTLRTGPPHHHFHHPRTIAMHCIAMQSTAVDG